MITISDITRLFRSAPPERGGSATPHGAPQQPSTFTSSRTPTAVTTMFAEAAVAFASPHDLSQAMQFSAVECLTSQQMRDLAHRLARLADQMERIN